MLQIHPNARTTPAVRAEIARSGEPAGALAKRYAVSTETVRKWRKRGAADCLDRSARPHRLPWEATEEERAVVCALRRATNFALDDLTFVVHHFPPHLSRDSVWRILRAEGLGRRPPPSPGRPKRGQGTSRDYDLGFVHIDIKHLPKLRPPTANGASATSTSPSTGAPAPRTRRSRTTRPRRARSPSSGRPRPPSRSGSPTC
jgi:transposase